MKKTAIGLLVSVLCLLSARALDTVSNGESMSSARGKWNAVALQTNTNTTDIAQNAADILTASPGNYSTVSNNAISAYTTVQSYAVDPNTIQTQVTANAEVIDVINTNVTANATAIALLPTKAHLCAPHTGDEDASGQSLWSSYANAGDIYSRAEASDVVILAGTGVYVGYSPPFDACPYDVTLRGLFKSNNARSTASQVGLSGLVSEALYYTVITNAAFSASPALSSVVTYEDVRFTDALVPNLPADWAAGTLPTNRFIFKNSRFDSGIIEAINEYVGASEAKWFDFDNCEFIAGGVLHNDASGNAAFQYGNTFSNCYFGQGVSSAGHGTNLPLTLYYKIWSDSTNYMFSGGSTTRAGAPFRCEIEDAYIVSDQIFQYRGKAGVGGEAASLVICDDVDFTNTVYGSWDIQGASIFRNCTRIDSNQTNYPVAITNCTDENNNALSDQ